ncbi:vacuolar basic amino acid transporter 5 [Trichomonascus vanleenenianus]|uniref:MDR family MFS transporter n=1 Tax=Trichomonascus vanleenenianus TaxID=2268995 RepID=UPI003ECA2C98
MLFRKNRTGSLSEELPQEQVEGAEKEQVVVVENAGTIEQHEMTKPQRLLLGGVLSLTLFIVALEQTISNSSLPQITAALGSANGYTWIGTAYLLASASVMPIYGKLSDIFGRKPVISAAIAIFLVGSAVAGAAQNMNMLIAARAVQGLGGGGVAGLINIIISDLVPLHQRGLFMGFIGSTWMVASCIGPLVGGALTQAGQWRWCFFLNLPVGGLGLAVLIFVLRMNSPKTSFAEGIKRIDFGGVALSATATCFFLIALDWGGTVKPWGSPFIICFLVFSGVLYVLFVVYEHYVPREPLIPLRLFTNRTRAMSYLCSIFHGMSFMGVVYFLPFMFQSSYGASPILASVYILPQAILMGLSSALGGLFISRFKRYVEQMWIGLGLTAVFIGLLSTLQVDSNTARRVIYPALYGLPVGVNFQTFLISLQTKIERKDIGVATSTLMYLRQIGMSFGIAIGGVAFQNRITTLAENSGNPVLTHILAGNAPSSVNVVNKLPPELREIARTYYIDSFRVVFYVFIGLAGAGFICSLFVPQNELKMKGDDKSASSEKVSVSEDVIEEEEVTAGDVQKQATSEIVEA